MGEGSVFSFNVMVTVVMFVLEKDVVSRFEEFSMGFTKSLINTYHDELASN